MAQNLVPVSEEYKKLPYYKYYLEEMVQASRNTTKVLNGPIDSSKALLSRTGTLFEPGYFEEEIGYCVMPDGTGYVSNLTKMPGVTAEDVRLVVRLARPRRPPLHHLGSRGPLQRESMQKEKGRTRCSATRKYWDTTHIVKEDVGMGPEDIIINFKNPGDLGFDTSKIGTEACSTIVCAHGMSGAPGTIMCHFVRDIEGGIELRTRFWMGVAYIKGRIVKMLPDGVRMPEAPLAR